MNTSRRIVIIDNEPAFAEALKVMLVSLDFEVTIATDSVTSDKLNLKDGDILFVDIRTRPLTWRQLLPQLARQEVKAAIVMMGRQLKPLEEAEKFAKKMKLNLIGAMEKPFRLDDLRDILPGTQSSLRQIYNINSRFHEGGLDCVVD